MPFRRRVPEQPTSSPPPLIPPSLSLFPHLAGARFHGCIPLSERRQHAWGPGAGASPNTLVFVSGSAPGTANKPRLFKPSSADKRHSLVNLKAFGSEHPSCVHVWWGNKFPIHQVAPEVGQPVCVCHRPLSGRRAGACSPDKPPLAEEVLLRIGLFVAC